MHLQVTYSRKNEQIPDETGAMPAPESARVWAGFANTEKRAVEKAIDYWENIEGKSLAGYKLQPVIDLDD